MVDFCACHSNGCAVLYISSITIVMLNRVKQRLRNLTREMDPDNLVQKVFDDPDIKEEMIEDNQKQMFDQGIDAEGDSLGEYSKVSVEVYGKRPGRIQLYDTGEFYNSMKVQVRDGEAAITGDMEKDGKDISKRWPTALGLTDESKTKVRVLAKEVIKDHINSAFGR